MKASALLALAQSIVSEFGSDSTVDTFVWHSGHVRDLYQDSYDEGDFTEETPETPSPELLEFVMGSLANNMSREESEFVQWKRDRLSDLVTEFAKRHGMLASD
jgi:hypothetical protein